MEKEFFYFLLQIYLFFNIFFSYMYFYYLTFQLIFFPKMLKC